MADEINVDEVLNVQGEICPYPEVKTIKKNQGDEAGAGAQNPDGLSTFSRENTPKVRERWTRYPES
jgi:hypothetical protein